MGRWGGRPLFSRMAIMRPSITRVPRLAWLILARALAALVSEPGAAPR